MARCLIGFSVLLFVALINSSLIPEEPPTPPSIIDEPAEATTELVPENELPIEPFATILSQSTSEVKSDGSFKFALDNGVNSILLYGHLRNHNGTKQLALDGTYTFGNISFRFIADHNNGFQVINLAEKLPQDLPPKVIASLLG